MDESNGFSPDMPLKDFMDGLLGLALKNESLSIRGHANRGGCIIRYMFVVDSVDLATAHHSDAETQH